MSEELPGGLFGFVPEIEFPTEHHEHPQPFDEFTDFDDFPDDFPMQPPNNWAAGSSTSSGVANAAVSTILPNWFMASAGSNGTEYERPGFLASVNGATNWTVLGRYPGIIEAYPSSIRDDTPRFFNGSLFVGYTRMKWPGPTNINWPRNLNDTFGILRSDDLKTYQDAAVIDCTAACAASTAMLPSSFFGGGDSYVAKTASYQFVTGDSGSDSQPGTFTFNGSSLTATLPSQAQYNHWNVTIINIAATNLAINGGGLLIDGSSSTITLTPNQGIFIWCDGVNYHSTYHATYGTALPRTQVIGNGGWVVYGEDIYYAVSINSMDIWLFKALDTEGFTSWDTGTRVATHGSGWSPAGATSFDIYAPTLVKGPDGLWHLFVTSHKNSLGFANMYLTHATAATPLGPFTPISTTYAQQEVHVGPAVPDPVTGVMYYRTWSLGLLPIFLYSDTADFVTDKNGYAWGTLNVDNGTAISNVNTSFSTSASGLFYFTAASLTHTLPSSPTTSYAIGIASVSACTVNPPGGVTINGGSSLTIAAETAYTITFDGTNYHATQITFPQADYPSGIPLIEGSESYDPAGLELLREAAADPLNSQTGDGWSQAWGPNRELGSVSQGKPGFFWTLASGSGTGPYTVTVNFDVTGNIGPGDWWSCYNQDATQYFRVLDVSYDGSLTSTVILSAVGTSTLSGTTLVQVAYSHEATPLGIAGQTSDQPWVRSSATVNAVTAVNTVVPSGAFATFAAEGTWAPDPNGQGYIIPKTGLYLVGASVYDSDAATTLTNIQVQLMKNGVSDGKASRSVSGTALAAFQALGLTVRQYAAGDILGVDVYQASGSTINVTVFLNVVMLPANVLTSNYLRANGSQSIPVGVSTQVAGANLTPSAEIGTWTAGANGFTAPADGLYLISAAVTGPSTTALVNLQAGVTVNGVLQAAQNRSIPGATPLVAFESMATAFPLLCKAGDYIGCQVFWATTSGVSSPQTLPVTLSALCLSPVAPFTRCSGLAASVVDSTFTAVPGSALTPAASSGGWTAGANGFTAPVAGTYFVTASVFGPGTTSLANLQIELTINGTPDASQEQRTVSGSATAVFQALSQSVAMSCKQGDYIGCQVYQASGSTQSNLGVTFEAVLIGATGAGAQESLDLLTAAYPTGADWSNNSHKITSLANGSASSDAAAFGQIPTAASFESTYDSRYQLVAQTAVTWATSAWLFTPTHTVSAGSLTAWTPGAGLTSADVECWGGGGGSGGAGSGSYAGATGGGAGGDYGKSRNIPILAGNSYNVRVAAGGTAGSTSGGTGGAGGFSSLEDPTDPGSMPYRVFGRGGGGGVGRTSATGTVAGGTAAAVNFPGSTGWVGVNLYNNVEFPGGAGAGGTGSGTGLFGGGGSGPGDAQGGGAGAAGGGGGLGGSGNNISGGLGGPGATAPSGGAGGIFKPASPTTGVAGSAGADGLVRIVTPAY